MSEEHDAFTRGFHDIPEDGQLRAMSYIALCDALHQATPGTPAFMVIEAEKRRRDSAPGDGDVAGQVVEQQEEQRPQDYWYNKPPAVIGLSVLAGLVLLAVTYLLRAYFGVDV